MMSAQNNQQVRSFNWMVAEAIGAIDERFLGRGRPMAEYRSAGYAEVEAFNQEPYAHHWFEKMLR
jgi:hypothetical protein